MLWFNFILGSNFTFLCFKLIIIHYNTQNKNKKIELRIKLNHNIHKTTLKGKKGGKATQANLTDDWAPKELLAELKRKFPLCHMHPQHLRLSTEAFAPVKRCSPLCYMY